MKGGENMEEYLSKRQVARMLGVCLQTVSRYMQSGRLKYIKYGETKSSRLLFKKSDIVEFMEKHKYN